MEAPKKNRRRGAEAVIPFSSETLLREAVRALLSRIPEVRLVKITHGSRELGKDILFHLPGGLGEPILCACVVKNAPLRGSVDSNAGVLTVLHQVEQALLNPKVLENGEMMQVKRVFVVTPFNLSDAAIASVQGHLRDRQGTVEFIAGSALFERFRTYWPDFLADEFLTLREHLKSTRTQLQEDKPLHNLSFQYDLSAPDKGITGYYVQPKFHSDIAVPTLSSQLCEVPARIDRRAPKPSLLTQAYCESARSATHSITSACSLLREWNCGDPAELTKAEEAASTYTDLLQRTWSYRSDDSAPELSNRPPNVYDEEHKLTAIGLNPPEMAAIAAAQAETLDSINCVTARLSHSFSTVRQFLNELSQVGEHSVLIDPRYLLSQTMNQMCTSSNGAVLGRLGAPHRFRFSANLLDSGPRSILIVGSAGFGKTSFCKWNALRDAERFSCGEGDSIPGYFPMYEIGEGSLQSFESTFLRQIGKSALLPAEAATQALTARRVRLYLDGLDEVPNDKKRMAIIKIIKEGVERWANVQVVITARDYVGGPWLDWLSRVHLSEFDDAQVTNLISNWFGEDANGRASFVDQMTQVAGLKPVMKVPLLATLVVLLFRQTKNLPASRARLFEMFVDLLNEGWDLAKGVRRPTKFGSLIKSSVLRRLAFAVHKRHGRTFYPSEVQDIIRRTIKVVRLIESWEYLLDELLRDGIIMTSGSTLRFSHLSFQEYLAAWHLKGDPNAKDVTHLLRRFLSGDGWWKETLCYYMGLSGNVQELREWVRRTAEGLVPHVAEKQAKVLYEEANLMFPGLL